MVTWEYPPRVVGGISPHVDGLAGALARAGHDVVVLTLSHPDAPAEQVVDGVRVLRCAFDLPWLPEDDLLAQMASVNHQLVQLLARLPGWRPDVVHAHDWLVAWAGDTLRALWDVPMVCTVHATERGRHGGHLPSGQPSGIDATEWWLTYQSREVICCWRRGGCPTGARSRESRSTVWPIQLGMLARWDARPPSVIDFACGRQSSLSSGTRSSVFRVPAIS